MSTETEKITPNAGWVGKLDLKRNKEAREQFKKNLEAARAAYNWVRYEHLRRFHEIWEPIYKAKRECLQQHFPDQEDFVKEELKAFSKKVKFKVWKTPNYTDFMNMVKADMERWGWIKEADSNAINAAIRDSYEKGAFSKFLKGTSKLREMKRGRIPRYPEDYGFPAYKKSINSFSTRISPNGISFYSNSLKVPKVKKLVKICHGRRLPDIPPKDRYVTISFDGFDYFVSIKHFIDSIEMPENKTSIIGVSTGLAVLATLSDGIEVPNPAKSEKLKKLEIKKRNLQRYMDELMNGRSANFKDLEHNKKWACTSKRVRKVQKHIRRLEISINDYKDYQMKLAANKIVSQNPEGIILRKDDVKKMQKNKRFSSMLQQAGMYKFKMILVNAAYRRGIEVRETEKYVKTTITCNHCGYEHTVMQDVSRRVFNCPNCGMKAGRAFNAASNIEELWALGTPLVEACKD